MSLTESFDYAEAARRLQTAGYDVTERWLRNHISQVPHVKIGRAVRFTDALLTRFIELNTETPAVSRPDGAPRPSQRGRHGTKLIRQLEGASS